MATELHPYFSIIRSPDDIMEVLHWGLEQCRGKEDHEAPYALGILAAIQWLTDESYPNPQDYLGPFTVENVLLQAKVAENIRNRSRAEIEELIRHPFEGFTFGGREYPGYRPTLDFRAVPTSESGVDKRDDGFAGNADDGTGEGGNAPVRP